MSFKCKICGRDIKTLLALSQHLAKHHQTSLLHYYQQYEDFEIPKCKFCARPAKLKSGITFLITCGSPACLSMEKSSRTYSLEFKEKARQIAFERMRRDRDQTAFARRWRKEPSYLERWFENDVVRAHDLAAKFDIAREYPFYPYFIDFAFLNVKLAVELDGKFHFDRQGRLIERDVRKNEFLVGQGWSVYRINYQQVTENAAKTRETLDKFIEYVDSIDHQAQPKIFENQIVKIKANKKRHLPRQEWVEKFRSKAPERASAYVESQRDRIALVKSSGIDFMSWGWSGQVAKLIGILPQKVSKWMKRCCPDIQTRPRK